MVARVDGSRYMAAVKNSSKYKEMPVRRTVRSGYDALAADSSIVSCSLRVVLSPDNLAVSARYRKFVMYWVRVRLGLVLHGVKVIRLGDAI